VDAACQRGERCLYFLFEESPQQLMRNMRSIGINLQQWVDRGILKFHADRPSRFGLETHLAAMQRAVRDFQPLVTVADPVTNLLTVGTHSDVRSMLTRVIDYLKSQSITGLFTSLTPGSKELEETDAGISSLMDTWIVLMINEENRRRRRWLSVLKSRGMAHSNSVREYLLTDHGLQVLDGDSSGQGRMAAV
jgi:circadian clock protein KaiC